MKNVNHILVPIDFSEPSTQALYQAVEFAKTLDASLHVVHVFTTPTYPYYDTAAFTGDLRAMLLSDAGARLAAVAKEAQVKFGVDVEQHLVEGVPHVGIKECAEEIGADMIVMATHGHSGLKHFFLGSVAEKVLRTSHVPVLTIRVLPTLAR